MDIRVRVHLREEFLYADHAKREHPGLVAVIAGAPVPFAKRPGNGKINYSG
jgi:hypothetical protein